MKSNYTQIIEAKTSQKIPLINGISICSKYDPVKEAKIFAQQYKITDLFFVIFGLGGGYHIKELLLINPDRKIIVVENCNEDFQFLRKIECVKEITENSNVILTTPENLFSNILNNYLPAIYGNLIISSLRSWENIFKEQLKVYNEIIEKVLDSVKRDFAVQNKFGKIWTKNIFENLKTASGIDNNKIIEKIKKNNSMTAAIIAAGPSLDNSIKTLKENRKKYFIISTDTAFSTLIRNEIIPDAVVSIDGQNISYNHFLHSFDNFSNTFFIFDLCANSSVAKKIKQKNFDLMFFESGHPLCFFASNLSGKNFIHLTSGAGTVTIAATDLAYSLGFTNVEVFANDFAYINGKPYTKGTYLDDLYSSKESKLSCRETSFAKLMYRTPLIKICDNKYTNTILISYKETFENYLKTEKTLKTPPLNVFDYDKFIEKLKNELNLLNKDLYSNIKTPVFYTMLPLMAFLENKNPIEKSYELARSIFLRYN